MNEALAHRTRCNIRNKQRDNDYYGNNAFDHSCGIGSNAALLAVQRIQLILCGVYFFVESGFGLFIRFGIALFPQLFDLFFKSGSFFSSFFCFLFLPFSLFCAFILLFRIGY